MKKEGRMSKKINVHISQDRIDFYNAEIDYKELPNIFKIIKDKVK